MNADVFLPGGSARANQSARSGGKVRRGRIVAPHGVQRRKRAAQHRQVAAEFPDVLEAFGNPLLLGVIERAEQIAQ
jgi:hypothetical protein